jgi:hypothetical protein
LFHAFRFHLGARGRKGKKKKKEEENEKKMKKEKEKEFNCTGRAIRTQMTDT